MPRTTLHICPVQSQQFIYLVILSNGQRPDTVTMPAHYSIIPTSLNLMDELIKFYWNSLPKYHPSVPLRSMRHRNAKHALVHKIAPLKPSHRRFQLLKRISSCEIVHVAYRQTSLSNVRIRISFSLEECHSRYQKHFQVTNIMNFLISDGEQFLMCLRSTELAKHDPASPFAQFDEIYPTVPNWREECSSMSNLCQGICHGE